MKKMHLNLAGILFLGLALTWACKKDKKDDSESYLPTDVLPSCTVTPQEFDSWFASGKASENGAVNPVNSVAFGHKDNCDFYKWSEQMFLWITSPSGGNYNDGGRVFESPVFYTVSPEDAKGKRHLIAHKKGLLMSAVPSLEKSLHLDSEQGQATGDALMSKDGSIVYYITMVNDVYAEFLKAVDEQKMAAKTFPTTQSALDSIVAYAKSKKITLPDANALAMELKSSWVDASTIKDLSTYITIDAMIPTYTKTATKWTITGERKAKLALLGVHIVGSTAGHPEMVWSTFEHKFNAPNLSYTYLDKSNKVKTVKADVTGAWVLNGNPSDTAQANVNVSHMQFQYDSIYAQKGMTVSPSNSTRTKPWGVANAGVPNPENATVAASNSQIISINNDIQRLLVGNDLRRHYLFIGSTWTSGGTAPDGTSYSATNTQAATAIGTSQLANTTMETYIQNYEGYNQNGSCFNCHHDFDSPAPTLLPTELSHVFKDLLKDTLAVKNFKTTLQNPNNIEK